MVDSTSSSAAKPVCRADTVHCVLSSSCDESDDAMHTTSNGTSSPTSLDVLRRSRFI